VLWSTFTVASSSIRLCGRTSTSRAKATKYACLAERSPRAKMRWFSTHGPSTASDSARAGASPPRPKP
jgi:hypothetical protein